MNILKIIGGLRITVRGQKDIFRKNNLFIISTHIGYLDGIVLGALVPGSFTTKSEIKDIPFIGRVVEIGGSIFIDRRKRNHIIDYVCCMTDRLKNGINIFNFPEGHATDGTKILPFFSAFFDAPLKAKSLVVPITIDYTKINGRTDFNRNEIYHYSESISIIRHLWNVLKCRSIEVVLTIHETIPTNGQPANAKTRKSLSNLCMQRLSRYNNLPISDDLPSRRFSDEPVGV